MHRDQVIGTQKEVDFVLVDLVGGDVVCDVEEHQKVEVVVLVDFGALMLLRRVFNGQWVKVEFARDGLKLRYRRRQQVEPQQIEFVRQHQGDA